MTEQQPRRSPSAAILTLLAALAVSGGVIATLGALSDHGEPLPAAASPNPGPLTTPNNETDTAPPAVGPPITVPTRTATPKAAKAAQAAGWLSDMPRKPVFPGTAAPASGQTHEGVVSGTPCTLPGALGHTRDGKLMTCAPAAKDPEARWREVVAPPSPR
ncbi:hypothetical protein [Paractinoplanes toevensis]|uniref:Uncharacterized protein n=1 Tax=Paractinoplanes toevensis TaxID=571911 RepID=A0A920BR33_9ACTN|nr:hypothetical protein [Actinoplanes toevensis]GIM97246.1 hypothetical protein Ato02nite_090390 [Actinoplanes toevensis]